MNEKYNYGKMSDIYDEETDRCPACNTLPGDEHSYNCRWVESLMYPDEYDEENEECPACRTLPGDEHSYNCRWLRSLRYK